MADLGKYLLIEFLPMQQDGGLWRSKDPVETAIHYLKAMSQRIERMDDEIDSLKAQIRDFNYG